MRSRREQAVSPEGGKKERKKWLGEAHSKKERMEVPVQVPEPVDCLRRDDPEGEEELLPGVVQGTG